MDAMFNPDPLGEVTITLPAVEVDPDATVLAVDFVEA